MSWKTVNIQLMNGCIFAVYGDSALFLGEFAKFEGL